MNQINLHTTFTIKFSYTNKEYSYKVEKTFDSGQIEHFTLYAANKNLVFWSNRPLLRLKKLKRSFDMKLHEGSILNMTFLETLINAIKQEVKNLENFIPKGEHSKDSKQKDFDWEHFEGLE